MAFPLDRILEKAASHPFYSKYFPSADFERSLSSFPLLDKSTLHNSMQSAIRSDAQFLRSVYISPTGGSSGAGKPLFFVTDTAENRRQRERAGKLMRSLRAIDENDICISLQGARALYRSLELTGELIEHAGGTNIPAGSDFPDENLVPLALQFHANTISGISSRLLMFARYLLSNPTVNISFAKVMYTSEPLPAYQEEYLRKAFHCEYIVSLFGSAECGPWAVSVPSKSLDDRKLYRELVFEADMVIVEIVNDDGVLVPQGEMGEVVVTSLMRLRNPLVRFRTGDIGSLHPYTAADGVAGGLYRCIRMYGRHPGKSFHLNGEKLDVVEIEKFMGQERWGVLEWQVVLDSDRTMQREESAEFRVVFKDQMTGENSLEGLKLALLKLSGHGIYLTAKLSVKAVEYTGLEMGSMANKIRKIVDRR